MRALILACLLCACDTAERKIERLGGKPPVVCFKSTPKYNSLYACRDGDNRYWICAPDGGCMPTDYPAEIFGGR